jgi:hypothetical protein
MTRIVDLPNKTSAVFKEFAFPTTIHNCHILRDGVESFDARV